MLKVDYIAQPGGQTTAMAINTILSDLEIKQLDVAAAYITSGGVDELLRTMNDRAYANGKRLAKRWITSFDYCRTDPIALPSSSVRIHDARDCLANRGVPNVPFHPKAFLFRSGRYDYALTGSGNISRSGLSRGFEAGLVICADTLSESEGASGRAAIHALQRWYEADWERAAPLSQSLLAEYRSLYESTANLTNAAPTDDDTATRDTSKGSLSNEDLKKLRVCRHFWIEAGNITRNRGPQRPGNQLMMKRFSRVFFGFAATAVPKNTPIGQVGISMAQRSEQEYSLTYSDNSMDKLVLPVPGSGSHEYYDNRSLLFMRIGPRRFQLTFGTDLDKKEWLRSSRLIGGAFKMSSGRQWGIF